MSTRVNSFTYAAKFECIRYLKWNLLPNLQPNEDQNIDDQDCEVGDDKYEEVESCHLEILIDEVIIIEF